MNLTMSLTAIAMKIRRKMIMDLTRGRPSKPLSPVIVIIREALIIFVRVFIIIVVKLIVNSLPNAITVIIIVIKFKYQMMLTKKFLTYIHLAEFFKILLPKKTSFVTVSKDRNIKARVQPLLYSFRLLPLSFLSVILYLWDA